MKNGFVGFHHRLTSAGTVVVAVVLSFHDASEPLLVATTTESQGASTMGAPRS